MPIHSNEPRDDERRRHHHGEISVDGNVTRDGDRLITAHITLSEDEWRLLTENQTVGMFQADTLANRIHALLFWELKVEAGDRRPLTNEDIAALDRLVAEAGSDGADEIEDVPF